MGFVFEAYKNSVICNIIYIRYTVHCWFCWQWYDEADCLHTGAMILGTLCFYIKNKDTYLHILVIIIFLGVIWVKETECQYKYTPWKYHFRYRVLGVLYPYNNNGSTLLIPYGPIHKINSHTHCLFLPYEIKYVQCTHVLYSILHRDCRVVGSLTFRTYVSNTHHTICISQIDTIW